MSLNQQSAPRGCFALKGHVTMPVDIFGCHMGGGERAAPGILCRGH